MRVMMMEDLCGDVMDVRWVSDRVMAVVLIVEDAQRLICRHLPQAKI